MSTDLFQQTLNMTLDHKCQIFLTLNGAAGEDFIYFTLWSCTLRKVLNFRYLSSWHPAYIHNLAFGFYIQQMRCCSSLEQTAYELGTQPTTLCRWSFMATETPKWVKDLCGRGRWMPLWHIRDISEQILFHSWWSFSTIFSHYIHKDVIWMHKCSHVQKMCSLERVLFIPYFCCIFPEEYFRKSACPPAFVFVLTLASNFPW